MHLQHPTRRADISAFHGGNTGSIPVGRANEISNLMQINFAQIGAYGKNTA
jgi:hypothetical protein